MGGGSRHPNRAESHSQSMPRTVAFATGLARVVPATARLREERNETFRRTDFQVRPC